MRILGTQPRLNGVRGIAILSVVIYHYAKGGWIPGGFLGVDLFFVLSGFLITALLTNEWDSAGAISLRSFYRRRALRLFPALAVVLALCSALAFYYSGEQRHVMIAFVLVTVTYLANLAVAIGVNVYYSYTWSLAAEEQFYLVWPVALITLLRRNVDRTRIAAGLTAAAALSWVLGVEAELAGLHGFAFFSPFTHAEGILFGCAAGILYTCGRLPRISPRLGLVGFAAYLLAVFTISPNSPAAVMIAIPLAALGGTLLVCAATESGRLLRWLEWTPLTYIGKVSYAMYLWNSIVFEHLYGIPRVLGIPLTVLAAALSMHFVERPFLTMKHRQNRRTLPEGAPLPARLPT